MIKGVAVKKAEIHADNRGFFAELVKSGEETFHDILQTSYAETNPGIIKDFHVHDYWEVWCVVKGGAQVVLCDLRPGSPTKGQKDVLVMEGKNLTILAIPGGVAHAYRTLGAEPAGMIYHASEAYDPKNITIKTIPFDSPEIGFDWGSKNDV